MYWFLCCPHLDMKEIEGNKNLHFSHFYTVAHSNLFQFIYLAWGAFHSTVHNYINKSNGSFIVQIQQIKRQLATHPCSMWAVRRLLLFLHPDNGKIIQFPKFMLMPHGRTQHCVQRTTKIRVYTQSCSMSDLRHTLRYALFAHNILIRLALHWKN